MDEVNIPRTFNDAGWPPQPAPERPGPGSSASEAPRQRLSTRARLAIGLTAAVVLAGGPLFGTTLSGSGAGTAQAAGAILTGSASSAGGSPAGSGQGARARAHACIASARRLRASGHDAAAGTKLRACFRRFFRQRAANFGRVRANEARLGFLLHRAMRGRVTIASKDGPKTIAFERGTVQSVSGSSIVIKAGDSVTLTWQVGSDARVYRGGQQVSADALATGQHVAVLGVVTGGTNQARRIFIGDHAAGR